MKRLSLQTITVSSATLFPLLFASCSVVPLVYHSEQAVSFNSDPSAVYSKQAVANESNKDESSIFFFDGSRKITESDLEKKLGAEIYGPTTSANLECLHSCMGYASDTKLFSSIKSIFFIPERYLGGHGGFYVGNATIKISSSVKSKFMQEQVILHEAAHAYADSLSNTFFWDEWRAVHHMPYHNLSAQSESYQKEMVNFIPHDGCPVYHALTNEKEHVADFTVGIFIASKRFADVPVVERHIFCDYTHILEKYRFVSTQQAQKVYSQLR